MATSNAGVQQGEATNCSVDVNATYSGVSEIADVCDNIGQGSKGEEYEDVLDNKAYEMSNTSGQAQKNSVDDFSVKPLGENTSTPPAHRAKRKAAFIGGAVALLLLIVVIDLVVSAAMKPKDQSGISYQITSAIKFTSCADDNQWVYADGKLLDSRETSDDQHKPVNVFIPAGTSVIGVKVRNNSGSAGWGGFFSDGKVTEAALWRCTTDLQVSDQWTQINYDDSDWLTPVHKFLYTCGSHPKNVQWLWTDNTFSSNLRKTIYCRARAGIS